MKRIDNRGVTLVELLVALAILSVVLVMVTGIYSYSMKAYKSDDAQWQIQQDARIIMDNITKDVRVALPGSISNPSTGQLIFKIRSSDADNPDKEVKYYIGSYDASDNYKLFREYNGGKTLTIKNVKAIDFSLDDGIVSVSLTMQKLNAGNVYTLSTKLYSRLY